MRISDWSSDVCSSDLLECHAFLGAEADALTHIGAIDDKIGPVIGDATDKNVDVRIVGVPMVDRDPIEAGPEITRHVLHQVAREAAEIVHRTEIGSASCRERVCPYV